MTKKVPTLMRHKKAHQMSKNAPQSPTFSYFSTTLFSFFIKHRSCLWILPLTFNLWIELQPHIAISFFHSLTCFFFFSSLCFVSSFLLSFAIFFPSFSTSQRSLLCRKNVSNDDVVFLPVAVVVCFSLWPLSPAENVLVELFDILWNLCDFSADFRDFLMKFCHFDII